MTPNLVLAANSADASDWLSGVAVLPDRREDRGGLAGVEAALASGDDVLVVAWDMPFVSADLLQLILSTAKSSDAEVVVPESSSPNGFEPFCSFYSAACAPALSEFLENQSAPADFVASRIVERIPLRDIRALGDPERLFFSVNSAADLMQARSMAGDAG